MNNKNYNNNNNNNNIIIIIIIIIDSNNNSKRNNDNSNINYSNIVLYTANKGLFNWINIFSKVELLIVTLFPKVVE